MTVFLMGKRYYHLTQENVIESLEATGSQRRAAIRLGVTQMTVSRFVRKHGIKFDGRADANVEKAGRQSARLREMYRSGVLKGFWKGKKVPKDVIELRVASRRGKKAWNSGTKKVKVSKCTICQKSFEHRPDQDRILCSITCSGKYMSKIYSDGRFDGQKNPNFGNGAAIKAAHDRGCYVDRPISKKTMGRGGYVRGVWLRSSWEIAFATALDEIGIDWKYESVRFPLSNRTLYIPDFFLPKFHLLVEVKGYWWPRAKEKFKLFRLEHPSVNLITIETEIWKQPLKDLETFLSTKAGLGGSIELISKTNS